MQVSDIEKKPENISSAASAPKSHPRGMVSVTRCASTALEDQLEDDLAAHVSEEQRRESGERPVHGLAAAPTAEIVAHQQAAEDPPRDESEDGLVVRLEWAPEELLGKEHPAHEREREQDERREQHAKEQRLHLEQRRQRLEEGRQHAAMQPLF